mmetsp:Transcript_28842/g.40778  ORF Transcript_28842/g.40778 Transcript_28842/m.40778 type:complete len:204 (-) Transcript_28842:1219-1830(-)
MGGCCSCCSKGESDGADVEMTAKAQQINKDIIFSRKMSAPTITVNSNSITGNGLAVSGLTIEQDAGYYEIILKAPKGPCDDVMFGLTTKKNRDFYKKLAEASDEAKSDPEVTGTAHMVKIPIKDDDVIGVAVQQSDLPMIQFLINGTLQPNLSVMRFKGQVYPSILVPEGIDLRATLVMDETEFKYTPPSSRFVPIMVARGLI